MWRLTKGLFLVDEHNEKLRGHEPTESQAARLQPRATRKGTKERTESIFCDGRPYILSADLVTTETFRFKDPTVPHMETGQKNQFPYQFNLWIHYFNAENRISAYWEMSAGVLKTGGSSTVRLSHLSTC